MEENYSNNFAGDPVFSNGSVAQSLSRVKNCLNFALKEKYGIVDNNVTDRFLKMHGLSSKNFDFINNFETLIEKGIADNSVDANANKGEKSISGFFVESTLPINKLVGYRYLYRKMKEMYGKKRAKFLAGEMYDMSLALADSTNIPKPYCFAVNASRLVTEGRPWGSLYSAPPKHLDTYIHCLSEIIHQLSNHLAGAIAVGSFFLDLAHMLIYRDKKTLTDLSDPQYRKDVENSLQSFVHSMNHLSRNSVESPFTNISIFDRAKILSLISDDSMGWYFEKEDPFDGIPQRAIDDCGDGDWKDYIVKVILEIEDIYMDIMDAGDKCHDGRPITFPVSTVNISRKKNDQGEFEFADEEFVSHICANHDIMRYNIYISEGTKTASCCRLINDSDLFELGGQVNSFGGTSLSLGSHRVVTINLRRIMLECSSWEDYKKRLYDRMNSAADILKAHKELLADLIKKGTQPFMSNGWLDLDKMFSTFGIMGYYEAAEDAKKRFGGDFDYIGDLVKTIDQYSREFTKTKGIITNVEEIPGENMAVKLANTDRWIYGDQAVSEPLYANQFIPLWVDATLHEKFMEEGRLSKLLTGGGICHYSLGEKITHQQAKKVIKEALKCGMEHFALNPTYSICSNDHFTFGQHKVCPKCGKPITDQLTRTVGFFVRTSNMTTVKREEDYKKRFYKGI
jgi:ribonucleoside-triphosphate reductase (formate)